MPKLASFDWLEVKTYYLTHPTVTMEELATKFGISFGYLRQVAAAEKWTETKREVQADTDKKVMQAVVETIADVKIRHAKIGKNLQNAAIRSMVDSEGNLTLKAKSLTEAQLALKTGVQIERDALGLNEKEVKDELYQRFQPFMFVLNLGGDELRRFIKSALSRGVAAISSSGPASAKPEGEGASGNSVGTTSLPEGSNGQSSVS